MTTETTTDDGSTTVTHRDVEELLRLDEQFVPAQLLGYHSTYHSITNLGARIGMGDVPDALEETDEFESLGHATTAAKTRLLSEVAQEHADAVDEALDAYHGDRS